MPTQIRGTLQTGAKGLVQGFVSNGATWIESFELDQAGVEIPNAATSNWNFLFKPCDGGAACLTLTEISGMTITQNTTETIFAIDTTGISLTGLCGDYNADLAQKATDGTVTHWLNGVVTFIKEDLGF